MKQKINRNWPTIYLDEHLNYLRSAFEPMRIIEISKSKFAGLDERDYVTTDLYRINGIFVTSDKVYAKELSKQKQAKHAGIIFIPKIFTNDQKFYFAETMAGYIMTGTQDDKFMCRSVIFYPSHDGPVAIFKGEETLLISWDELEFIDEEMELFSRR